MSCTSAAPAATLAPATGDKGDTGASKNDPWAGPLLDAALGVVADAAVEEEDDDMALERSRVAEEENATGEPAVRVKCVCMYVCV